jgi:hypothetical protein
VHFGLANMNPVDVEVIFPHGGKREVIHVPRVDARRMRGRALVVKVAAH